MSRALSTSQEWRAEERSKDLTCLLLGEGELLPILLHELLGLLDDHVLLLLHQVYPAALNSLQRDVEVNVLDRGGVVAMVGRGLANTSAHWGSKSTTSKVLKHFTGKGESSQNTEHQGRVWQEIHEGDVVVVIARGKEEAIRKFQIKKFSNKKFK